MTLGQAWQAAKEGRPIARAAWGRGRPPLRIAGYAEDDPMKMGWMPRRADSSSLDVGDIAATDWMVVDDA